MTMLNGLQEEIAIHPEFVGASREIIINALNADGTSIADTWVTMPLESRKIAISKLKLLTYLTGEQRKGLRVMLAGTSDAEKDLAMLYNSDDTFWINDPFFLEMLTGIYTALAMDDSVFAEIKRLGERKISRAEELFGRLITEGDFK